jgi:prepilin-type N-terminal cleavage/methylation domain-containing protein
MKNNLLRGFTLLEMLMVLVVSTTLIGGGTFIYNRKVNADRISDTQKQVEFIKQAYIDFFRVNLYVPCSGREAYAYMSDNPSFGMSNYGTISFGSVHVCDGNLSYMGSPSPEPGTRYGLVPIFTLNIPLKYAFDAWGRQISVGVVSTCAKASRKVSPAYTAYFTETNNTTFVTSSRYFSGEANSISDNTCGTGTGGKFDLTSNASEATNLASGIVVIYSHGKNGFGAFKMDGTGRYIPTNSATFSAEEKLNALHNGTAYTYNSNKLAVTNINLQETTSTYRDDILTYITKEELISKANLLPRYLDIYTNTVKNPICANAERVQTLTPTTICGSSNTNCISAMDQMSKMINNICI